MPLLLVIITVIQNIGYKINKVEESDITNCIYYFFNDMIDIKNLDLNKTEMYKKPYKNTITYYISYVKASVPYHQ